MNNIKYATASGSCSISSSSSVFSASGATGSAPGSKYGEGDSGGSDTFNTGVNGCTGGGDHPNESRDIIILLLRCDSEERDGYDSVKEGGAVNELTQCRSHLSRDVFLFSSRLELKTNTHVFIGQEHMNGFEKLPSFNSSVKIVSYILIFIFCIESVFLFVDWVIFYLFKLIEFMFFN